jgi:Ca-activated chloride channel family protein
MSITVWNIHWARPAAIGAMPIIVLIIVLYWYRQYKVHHVIAQLGGKWRSLIIRNFSRYRQWGKFLLFSMGLISLGLALMRPQWQVQEKKIAQEGRDIVIALDISRSMLAADCTPNRLAVAKDKIKQLLERLNCDRVGLILFSGSAMIQCPLTTDYDAFYMFLNQVDVETIASGSTSLQAALTQAVSLFEQTPERVTRLMVIFTDGEDFSSNLSACKVEANKQRLHIFAVGVGTQEGAPIPLYDIYGKRLGYQQDEKGKIVISQRNEDILHRLATDVGGIYIPLTTDDKDIGMLVENISAFQKEHFEDKRLTMHDDKYHYFILWGLGCLLGEWIL